MPVEMIEQGGHQEVWDALGTTVPGDPATVDMTLPQLLLPPPCEAPRGWARCSRWARRRVSNLSSSMTSWVAPRLGSRNGNEIKEQEIPNHAAESGPINQDGKAIPKKGRI